MQNTYIFPARLFLGATLGAFVFAFGSSAALAQTADDVSQRLSAEQAKNAQLEKENAALRERLKMEENAQARPQVHHVNHAQQKTTPQQAASAALSDQTAIANSAVLAGNPLPLAAPLTCVFQVAGSCVHGWLGAGYLWFRANNQTLPPIWSRRQVARRSSIRSSPWATSPESRSMLEFGARTRVWACRCWAISFLKEAPLRRLRWAIR